MCVIWQHYPCNMYIHLHTIGLTGAYSYMSFAPNQCRFQWSISWWILLRRNNIFGKKFKVELKFICAEFQIFSTLSKHDITILVNISHGNRSLTSYSLPTCCSGILRKRIVFISIHPLEIPYWPTILGRGYWESFWDNRYLYNETFISYREINDHSIWYLQHTVATKSVREMAIWTRTVSACAKVFWWKYFSKQLQGVSENNAIEWNVFCTVLFCFILFFADIWWDWSDPLLFAMFV